MDTSADVVNWLHGMAADLGAADTGQLVAAIKDLATIRVAWDAVWLQAAGRADERGVGRLFGARTTGDWLADVAGERRGTMMRDVELASSLAEAPVIAEAMGKGLSKAKAAELVESGLPEAVQHELAERALSEPLAQVASDVRRARFEHGLSDRPVEPTMTLVSSKDHVRIEATLDLVGGEFVKVALDTAAANLSRDVPYRQRRAQALVALARFYLDNAPALPATRTGRPHGLVFVNIDTLVAEDGGSATLGSGAVISGDQARRLLCDANVTRVITNGRSEILDVGRSSREPPVGLAKAVIARDRHCRFVGCHAPPWMCDVHHARPWAKGGPTSLHNLGLACWFHHELIHERGAHRLTVDADGRWVLPPPIAGAKKRAA